MVIDIDHLVKINTINKFNNLLSYRETISTLTIDVIVTNNIHNPSHQEPHFKSSNMLSGRSK